MVIGSTLSRIITNANIDFVRGLLSLCTVLLFDFTATFLMSRSKTLQKIIKGPPLLVCFRGAILTKTCHSNR